MKIRATSLIGVGVLLATVLLALIVQIALLGALNLRAAIGEIALVPVFNAQVTRTVDGTAIYMDNSRGAAAVQASNLSVNADDALAVVIYTDERSEPQRLSVAWITLQERRRGPAGTNVATAPRPARHETIIVLRGHPRWSGNITQMGLSMDRAVPTPTEPFGSATTTLRKLEFIPASPSGALRLMSNAWFSTANDVITPPESANRILPLALWLALVAVTSVAMTALVVSFAMRGDPARRAAALRACSLGLFAFCAAATVFYARFPGLTAQLVAGLLAALALWLIDPPFPLPFGLGSASEKLVPSLAMTVGAPLVLVALCASLAPMVASVLCLAGGILLIARYVAPAWATRATMLSLVPILYVAAVAQGMVPAPTLLTPLADPTGTLASVATNASGLPGLVLGAVALNRFWPAAAQAPRWSIGAGAAAVWAFASATAVLAIPRLAVQAQGFGTYVALFLPFVTCLVMAVWPRLRSVAEAAVETRDTDVRAEADLSAQAMMLLDGQAEVVRSAVVQNDLALGRAALRQMTQLAPGARATRSAHLCMALAEGNVSAAESSASVLAAMPDLRSDDYDSLLELAHRQGNHTRVLEVASLATASANRMRYAALAELMLRGPQAALDLLLRAPDPAQFAQEIAELHLLNDEVKPTQQALSQSGIALNEATGVAYVARLGMRVQGVAPHAKAITDLSMWHPQLGAAQAAHGDLLLRQGNAAGARARYMLAVKLDPALWALQYRVAALDKGAG